MIVFHIKGQELSVVQPTIVSDTIDYLTARFVFKTSEWNGLQKWAHFAKDNVSYDILLSEDEIKKNQHLNLSDGTWNVYLHGTAVEDGEVVERITTEIVNVSVKKSGVLNGLPLPDVPASAAEQIFAAAQEAINVANSVRDDADSGAFDGQDAKINGYNIVSIVAGENVRIEQNDNTLTISSTGGGGEGGTSDHRQLSNRNANNQHPINAITGLQSALDGKQPVGDYATTRYVNNHHDDTKQDVISDLSAIRSGASKGSTAYQKPTSGIPASDLASGVIPSVPTALSQLSGDSTHRVVTDAEKSTWNEKQSAISDLATIRSGAALGATAVQPEEGKGLFSGSYNDLRDKPTIPAAVTEYLKSASVSGNTLNLTKQDDSTLSFTPQGGGGGEKHWQLIKSATVPADPASDTSGVTWVTNANGIYRFVIDDDNDENPFSYKKVRLIVKTPSKEAGGCCTGNFKPLLGINIPAPTDNEGWVFLPYQLDKDWASVIIDMDFENFADPFVKTDFTGNANAAWGVYPGYYENYASFHRENLCAVDAVSVLDKKIHNVAFHMDGVTFKAGVIVELYAEV